jgi:hypothetical protein
MKVYAVTGPRFLLPEQQELAIEILNKKLLDNIDALAVGDAPGVDQLVRDLASTESINVKIFEATSFVRYELQARSMRMIDWLAQQDNGVLLAFVNKECPVGLTVKSWKGSGSWGTARYAVNKGICVELFPLIELANLPSWLQEQPIQLSLI